MMILSKKNSAFLSRSWSGFLPQSKETSCLACILALKKILGEFDSIRSTMQGMQEPENEFSAVLFHMCCGD